MPTHIQVTKCLRGGGPTSNYCSCEHCTLAVCSVCGAYEDALTTDCPGVKVSFDKQKEVRETNLDYTDERGFHQGSPMERRTPRFAKEDPAPEKAPAALPNVHLPRVASLAASGPVGAMRIIGCTCGWRTPQGATDSDDAFTEHATLARLAPAVDWAEVERTMDLQYALAQKAIAWVQADRICEDHSAACTRLEDEIDECLPKGQTPDARGLELLGKLEYAKVGFKLADQRAVRCDDEFRQAARKLVAELEKNPSRISGLGEHEP